MKNIFWKELLSGFKLVFRAEGVTGPVRTLPTPSKPEINKNINNFLKQWQSKEFDGEPVLSPETVSAIEKLRKHVNSDCVTNIPVALGTNKNERLHRFLNNSALHVSRIGPELAVAILSTLLYHWNSGKLNTGEYKPTLPIFRHGPPRHGNIAGDVLQNAMSTSGRTSSVPVHISNINCKEVHSYSNHCHVMYDTVTRGNHLVSPD